MKNAKLSIYFRFDLLTFIKIYYYVPMKFSNIALLTEIGRSPIHLTKNERIRNWYAHLLESYRCFIPTQCSASLQFMFVYQLLQRRTQKHHFVVYRC